MQLNLDHSEISIVDEITREVIFTDYHCAEPLRVEISVTQHQGRPVATMRIPEGTTAIVEDIREPDLLRSYAACLLAAAYEMERMNAKVSGERSESAGLTGSAAG